ncbi:hypothetical protein VE25_16375 [Devosia geojensis]|uniref:DUF2865 domain-containing protein n=1 Tax=Devosia geojensis TaxID=443610 RepID=A0A0F5FPG6_9HYPH|nr:DUF2865 domain-containing protein [Devosia geojensis]KKB10736.1 hypothetical protein VE25_16375 [Devosia geojensis]
MGKLFASALRLSTAIFIALVVVCANISLAHAQSSCRQLQAALNQLNRNQDFRNYESGNGLLRQLRDQVQAAESAYVRNGCNADARAGRVLTPQCQGIAREVLRLRNDFSQASSSVNAGGSVAQQREAVLQEMARFGCGTDEGSSATFSPDRQALFDRVYGSSSDQGSQVVENQGGWSSGGYRTVRTLCVRLTDGYFWPISYSTLQDYVGQDAAACQQMCPGTPVELYFYDNPGQEPEQMRNMLGQPYSNMPNAFRYREAFDTESSCKPQNASGSFATVEAPNGQSRTIIDYQGATFPLPLRDPRQREAVPAVAVAAADPATYVEVPLPRRRPAGPGEAPQAQPIENDNQMRLVRFGNRTVRVVGPDTPYAQATGAGT